MAFRVFNVAVVFLMLLVVRGHASAATAQVLRSDAPAKVREYFELSRKAAEAEAKRYREELATAKRELGAVRTGRVDTRLKQAVMERGAWTFPSAKLKAEKIAEVEARVAELESQAKRMESPGAMGKVNLCGHGSAGKPLEVGSVGWVDRVIVRQVISDTQVLAQVGYDESERINRRIGSEFISYVVLNPKYTNAMLISDIDASGLSDDRGVEFDRPFIVVGTYRYETVAGGVRTVLNLKPFDLNEFMEPAGEAKK